MAWVSGGMFWHRIPFFLSLSRKDGAWLADYFLDVYAKKRHAKNDLRRFEGFIYEGPEYLSVFAGDGQEITTIPFPFPREDDGLRWGDYAMPRIEPCNRSDRFLSAAAYLDGIHPSLIICRGYYTRSCIAAYDLKKGSLRSGFGWTAAMFPWKIRSAVIHTQKRFQHRIRLAGGPGKPFSFRGRCGWGRIHGADLRSGGHRP